MGIIFSRSSFKYFMDVLKKIWMIINGMFYTNFWRFSVFWIDRRCQLCHSRIYWSRGLMSKVRVTFTLMTQETTNLPLSQSRPFAWNEPKKFFAWLAGLWRKSNLRQTKIERQKREQNAQGARERTPAKRETAETTTETRAETESRIPKTRKH